METLPPEIELALAYTPHDRREAMRVAFELDRRLARIVAATTEPMLGQMRLAWWRDVLAKPVDDRPRGDAVLDAIGRLEADTEGPLAVLVDAWEAFLVAEDLGPETLGEFSMRRASGIAGNRKTNEASPGQRWALADVVLGVSDADERRNVVDFGLSLPNSPAYPRDLRGLSVLDALAARALKRGGRPLMEGRGASLVALRAGMLGR